MSEADTKEQIVKRATLAMEKLSAKDGDLIVITFPSDVAMEQISVVAQYITECIPEGVSVLCTKDSVSVQHLPKAELNDLGWYNINSDVGSGTIN